MGFLDVRGKRGMKMKKKIVAMMLAGVMACGLWACGGSEESDGEKKSQNKEETVTVPKEEKKDISFENDTLSIEDAVIKITGTEVAPPNPELGEEKSTIIFTYDYTNTSDEVMQPGTVWIACFNATQETDATIEDLEVAMAPQDEKYTQMNEMSFTDVKPGATVQSVISYEISDTAKPVTLTATQGIAGEELGSKVINLQ